MKFGDVCTQCGACCRLAYKSKSFPKKLLEGKKCIHYDEETRTCNDYKNRPDICRVDKGYYKHKKRGGKAESMTKKQYIILVAIHCNEMQKNLEIDEKYRIPLRDIGK